MLKPWALEVPSHYDRLIHHTSGLAVFPAPYLFHSTSNPSGFACIFTSKHRTTWKTEK